MVIFVINKILIVFLLFRASLANKSAIVSLLLQAGVNPNQQDSLGKTPISWVSDRITHMRTAIYHRRLQYADEDEIVQIKEKLLNELYTMINQLNTWSQNWYEILCILLFLIYSYYILF